jgi:hypothetical protein
MRSALPGRRSASPRAWCSGPGFPASPWTTAWRRSTRSQRTSRMWSRPTRAPRAGARARVHSLCGRLRRRRVGDRGRARGARRRPPHAGSDRRILAGLRRDANRREHGDQGGSGSPAQPGEPRPNEQPLRCRSGPPQPTSQPSGDRRPNRPAACAGAGRHE